MIVIHLKNSAKDVALLYRNNDMCLSLFESLIKTSDIALLKRIKAERVLDAEDFFYLGFHFSEKLFELREFGLDIIKLLVKRYPRSKVTTKAKITLLLF